MSAYEIAAEVARNMSAEAVGRDIYVADKDVVNARDLAVTFGAVHTTAAPSAVLGQYRVTVWTE